MSLAGHSRSALAADRLQEQVVLCGVDATEGARSVVAAARTTAERAGAPLLLAHVVGSLWEADVPAFREEPEDARAVAYGPAGRQLLALADRRGAGLIVLGTRGLGRIERLWRGSVSRYVARRAQCPVMIVGPRADPRAPATGAHVACAGDDAAVLADAALLARRLGAELVIVGPPDALRDVDTGGVAVDMRPGGDLAAAAEGAAAVVVGWRGRALVLDARVPVVVRHG